MVNFNLLPEVERLAGNICNSGVWGWREFIIAGEEVLLVSFVLRAAICVYFYMYAEDEVSRA